MQRTKHFADPFVVGATRFENCGGNFAKRTQSDAEFAGNRLLRMVIIDITGCAVAQHCYNGDVNFLWENGNLTVCKIETLEQIDFRGTMSQICQDCLRPRDERLFQIW